MLRIRNFPGKILALFLLMDPIFDWLTTSTFNLNLGPLKLSDTILFGLLLMMVLYMGATRFRGYRPDLFVIFNVLFLIQRVLVDVFNGLGYYQDYLPRTLFSLLLYMLAVHVKPSLTNWTRLAYWTLGIYCLAALPQTLPSLLSEERVTSIFLNPNFLAFNVFNVMLLLYMFPPGRKASWIVWSLSMSLMLLTKTRSVLLSMVWFVLLVIKRNRWIVFLVIALVAVFISNAEFFRLGSTSGLGSLNGRIQIWRAIISATDKMNLFFGSGTNVVARYEILPYYNAVTGKVEGYLQPQNHYILLLVESGVVGFLLWWGQILGYIRDLLRTPKSRVRDSVLSFVGALLTIQLMENEIFANPTTLLIMGLAIAQGRQLQLEESHEDDAA